MNASRIVQKQSCRSAGSILPAKRILLNEKELTTLRLILDKSGAGSCYARQVYPCHLKGLTKLLRQGTRSRLAFPTSLFHLGLAFASKTVQLQHRIRIAFRPLDLIDHIGNDFLFLDLFVDEKLQK